MDSNIVDLPPNNKSGLYIAPLHTEGGVQVIVDGVKKIEVEGDEYHLSRLVLMNNKEYEFKNKTSLEILDYIFKDNKSVFSQGKAESSDYIICRLAVLDKTKHDFYGTAKDFVNLIQGEHGCKTTGNNDYTYEHRLGGSVSDKKINNLTIKYKGVIPYVAHSYSHKFDQKATLLTDYSDDTLVNENGKTDFKEPEYYSYGYLKTGTSLGTKRGWTLNLPKKGVSIEMQYHPQKLEEVKDLYWIFEGRVFPFPEDAIIDSKKITEKNQSFRDEYNLGNSLWGYGKKSYIAFNDSDVASVETYYDSSIEKSNKYYVVYFGDEKNGLYEKSLITHSLPNAYLYARQFDVNQAYLITIENGKVVNSDDIYPYSEDIDLQEIAKDWFNEYYGVGEYDKKELEKGIKVEEEHKDTVEKLAKGEITAEEGVVEIAKAHLDEDPKYYDKLEILEGASKDSEKELEKLLDKKSKLESRLYEAKLVSNAVFENMGWGSGMRKSKISISTTKEDEIANKIKVIDKRIQELKGLNSKDIPNDEINKIIRDLSTMDAGLKDYDDSFYKSGYDKLLSSNENAVLSEMRKYIQFQKDYAKYLANKESKDNADKWLDSLVKLEYKLTKDFSESEGLTEGVTEGVNSEKQELIDLIELLKEAVKENPKDEDSKDTLELYQETLKNIESKFEKGGSLDLLAPNGKTSNLTPEQYKLVRSPEFISWFGNWIEDPKNSSKVVDENGEPLLVYHRNKKMFNMFDTDKQLNGWLGKGFYFSESKLEFKDYGKIIISAFLNIKNPFKVKGESPTDFLYELKQMFDADKFDTTQILKENKYDGVIYKHWDYEGNMFSCFESNQIKLADGSNTTFDGSNPDIRFENGGGVEGSNDTFTKAINKMINDGTNPDGKKNQMAIAAEFIRDFDLDTDFIIKSKYVDLSYWVKKAMPIHTGDYNDLVQSLYARQQAHEINPTSLQFIYSFYSSDVLKFIPNWIIKAKKELKLQSPYLTEDTIAYANDYLSRLEAFVPIALKFEQMKSKIGVKKELTKEEKVEKERQKIQDDIYNSMPVINKVALSKLVSDIQKEFKPLEIEIYNREVKRYRELCQEYSKKEKVFAGEFDRIFPFGLSVFNFKVISAYEMNETKGYNDVVKYITKLELKPDWINILNDVIKRHVETLKWRMIQSVIKNFEKVISPIKKITKEYLTVGKEGFEGSFLIEFENGGSFIFKTEAIGAGGYHIQVFHFRYISNFTDIKMPDGSKGNWIDLVSDDEFENGGAISFDKVISASTRFRPSETVVFDPPLEGKNGAKLISYTWSYEWTMKPSNEGELVSKRVSDWTQAEISADTGRDIVHQYTILMPNGEYKTVSSDSVPVLLGYLDKKELKSFPNLVTASKTLAKQQMQLAILEAQKKEYDELYAKFEKAEKPEIKEVGEDGKFQAIIESYKKGAYSNYSMGDITHRQDNDYIYETQEYKKRPITRDTIEQLTWQWISKRVAENGGVNPRGLYDLKNRVARQKRKVENILNTKMENGGEIEDFDFSSLFNEESSEEKESREKQEKISEEQEKEDWYQKSRFSKKWASTLKEAIDKTVKSYFDAKATYDDWSSRQYKSNKGMVYAGGDDIHGAVYTIGGINENRRQNTLRGAKMQMEESIEDLKSLGLTKDEISDLIGGDKFANGGKVEVNKVSVYQTDFSGLSFSDLGGYFDSKFTEVIDLEDSNVKLKPSPIFLLFKNPYDIRTSENISIDDVIGAVLPKKMEKDARLIFDKRYISYVTYSDDANNENKIEAIKKLADINEDIILK